MDIEELRRFVKENVVPDGAFREREVAEEWVRFLNVITKSTMYRVVDATDETFKGYYGIDHD